MADKIKLIPFLDKVVERNTRHYKQDFQQDAQKLRDAIRCTDMDERTFYFMSRPSGTWCVLERDVFLRDSDGYKIWTQYADMPDGIEAYRVTITGHTGEHSDIPLGAVVKINYREQVQRVIEKALPVEAVELTFYSREQITLPIDKYRNNQEQIFFDYGAIQHLRYIPENEADLCRAILMEHRFQKGWKPRKGQKPQNPSR